MGRPKFDTGLCYDAASAPDRQRLTGPVVDAPPGDWTSSSNTPWYGPDLGDTVETWKAANYPGGQVAGTGDTITQDTPITGTAQLDDSAGAFTADMVGQNIEISGASNANNDGVFEITAYNSATQIEYANAIAVTETSSFSYAVNPSDLGYGSSSDPTKSWRFDVELPDGWYVRSSTRKKYTGQQ